MYESTKTASDAATGEKGIGFKSVFGVADVAWIASAGFRIKLYAESEKAMRPDWFEVPFPDKSYAKDEGTTMYFELAKRSAQHVRQAVERFDPSIMLFLKKLKKIDLLIEGESIKQLVRIEKPLRDGSTHIIIAENGRHVLHYNQFSFPFETTVRRKEDQENRSSQIKLAFPVNEDVEHIIHRDEKVYACLPIKNFGFKVSPTDRTIQPFFTSQRLLTSLVLLVLNGR